MVDLSKEEKDRLMTHLALEESRERSDNARMEKVEEDLQPLKKMYWALLGCGGVASMLLLTLLFIYSNDRAAAASMQEAIYRQGTAIEVLLRAHANLEQNLQRETEQLRDEIQRLRK